MSSDNKRVIDVLVGFLVLLLVAAAVSMVRSGSAERQAIEAVEEVREEEPPAPPWFRCAASGNVSDCHWMVLEDTRTGRLYLFAKAGYGAGLCELNQECTREEPGNGDIP
jgi:hypothetical protein